eukprot:scaffold11332_cov94-Isochrysis_galbana.AAC.3
MCTRSLGGWATSLGRNNRRLTTTNSLAPPWLCFGLRLDVPSSPASWEPWLCLNFVWMCPRVQPRGRQCTAAEQGLLIEILCSTAWGG